MFQFEFLNISVTVSHTFNVILVPPLKLDGVITTAFVPDDDTFKIVLICPFAPSSKSTWSTC